jgi:anti-sigma B factor antagonist
MAVNGKGLSFHFKDEDTHCLVTLAGDLNMFSAPEFRNHLVKKLESGAKRILLDLSELIFIDSSGIGVLVSFVTMARKNAGAKIVLCGLKPQIRSIFEVTRLLSVFNVVEDRLAAEKELMT